MDGESGSQTGRGDLSILATFCNEDRKTPLPKEILGTQTSGMEQSHCTFSSLPDLFKYPRAWSSKALGRGANNASRAEALK